MQVSAQELLKMYNNVVNLNKSLQIENERLNKSVEFLRKENNDSSSTIILLHNEIEIKNKDIKYLNERIERLINYNNKLEKEKVNEPIKTKFKSGVDLVGDLNDYEYTTENGRMLYLNYKTGNRVYSGDPLWNDLKRNQFGKDFYYDASKE